MHSTSLSNTRRLFDVIEWQANRFPKEDLLCGKENGNWCKYSTHDVMYEALQISAGLLQLGIGGKKKSVLEQDKVAIISKNRPEWLILDLACQQIGVILCPIYPTTPASEIEFIFNDANIKYVFISGKDILHKIKTIQPSIPSIQNVFSFDDLQGVDHWKMITSNLSKSDTEKVTNYKHTIETQDCATIIYTSGTTGLPKGVMLSHENFLSNVKNSIITFPFPEMPHGKALSFLPLNHIFERMVSYIYIACGISIYYAEGMETIGNDLKEVQPQIFTTVPRLLEKVFDKIMQKGASLTGIKKKLFYWAVGLAEKYNIPNHQNLWYKLQLMMANKIIFNKWREALGGKVQFIVTGGAACQLNLLKIFNAAQIPVYEGYGPTENSPVISVNCHKKRGTNLGTVGLPIEGQEVKIAEDGEICVKGPSVMMGYYNRPDLTEEVIIDGWLHTGDIGVWEDGKYLKITDRKKELFKNSGGKYIAPQVIENAFKTSPFIEQIMVVGANEKYVCAIIIPSFENLHQWMAKENIEIVSKESTVQHEKVQKLFKEVVKKHNTNLNPIEQVKKFELLIHEWSVETGELTPKMSMRRKIIMEKNQHIINRFYL